MASGGNLKAPFGEYCSFGQKGSVTLSDKQCTKWFKDAKLYGKQLTTADTDIAFSKVKEKGKKDINFEQFEKLLTEVVPKYKGQSKLECINEAISEMTSKLAAAGPSTAGTTGVSKTGNVNRMTDHTLYTGAHKGRFNEDGTGKGIDGRVNRDDTDGYVGNYKGKGTYDNKK